MQNPQIVILTKNIRKQKEPRLIKKGHTSTV